MQTLFSSGHIVDLIVTLMVLEALFLSGWHFWTGRGIAPRKLIANFLAGALLLIGLRAALLGLAWPEIALPLVLALVAHLADLLSRWPGRATTTKDPVLPPLGDAPR